MPVVLRNVGIAVLLAVMAIGLHQLVLYRAERRAVDAERARVAAQANQDISERRATDAKFDRMDAMALCREVGLEWYADEGRSYCRVKPAT